MYYKLKLYLRTRTYIANIILQIVKSRTFKYNKICIMNIHKSTRPDPIGINFTKLYKNNKTQLNLLSKIFKSFLHLSLKHSYGTWPLNIT
jgi:hypothetical protein